MRVPIPSSHTMLPPLLCAALLGLASAKPVTFISAEPTYTVCNESVLTWADGAPPYAVKAKIGPDNDRKFRTIQQHLNTTTYTFFVDLPAGTDLELWIQDSSGEQEAIPGDASIRQFVRANPGRTCPLYLFPGETLNTTTKAPVTTTQTVISTVMPSETQGSDSATQSNGEKKTSNTGQIVGGVVGGVLGAALVAGLLFWIWRLRRQVKKQYNEIEYEDQTGSAPNIGQAGMSQPTIATSGLAAAGAGAGSSSGSSAAAGSVVASQHPTLVREPNPSPEIKAMQLDAMLSPNSPQRTPNDSPSPGYFPAQHPGTPGTPKSNVLAALAGLTPPHAEEHESEYEVDAGPAFPTQQPARTVHPPQYRDVGKI